MLNDEELQSLMRDLESDRVERKASLSDFERICEAACEFANDLPGHSGSRSPARAARSAR